MQTLRAYIGLLLLAGVSVYRSKGECATELWDDKRGRPIFRATMSLEQFRLRNSCIRFDDKSDRLDRRQRDKLAAICNMVSYVPKKKKFVTLLCTLHTKKEIRDSDKKNPEIIHYYYYNATKSEVDVLDERIGTYRCKRKVNRWPMALFANIIDISAFNSFVIYTELNPSWKEAEKNIVVAFSSLM